MSAASQDRLVDSLIRRPSVWPGLEPDEPIRVIETHISRVLLAGEFAWKIKKPVRFDFLDFSTLPNRRKFCREELRLNRRLARELYLDVVPVTGSPEAPRIGGKGEPIEFAIKMRRFEQDELYLERARSGRLEAAEIDEVAEIVADFHQAAERSGAPATCGAADQVRASAEANFPPLISSATSADERERTTELAEWSGAESGRLARWFDRRRADGFVRECHGDLHLRNIVRFRGRPCVFDCIEFNDAFRWIDIMSEVAFLVSDLEETGLPEFGWRFLNRWLEGVGDYAGLDGLPFYLVYRALVRAKVDAIRLQQQDGSEGVPPDARESIEKERRSYLRSADRFHRRQAPLLIIMHGLSGSGKTFVSGQLLGALGAIRIRSDVERKRLAGLDAVERTGAGLDEGLYSPENSRRVYDRLATLAESVLGAGFTVIVDAAFLSASDRKRFADLAVRAGVEFRTVSCMAPESLLRRRLAERARDTAEASDADEAVLNLQLRKIEPITESECAPILEIDAGRPASFAEALQELR